MSKPVRIQRRQARRIVNTATAEATQVAAMQAGAISAALNAEQHTAVVNGTMRTYFCVGFSTVGAAEVY